MVVIQLIPLFFVLLLAIMRVAWVRSNSQTWLPKWMVGLSPSSADQQRNRIVQAVVGLSNYEQMGKAVVDRRRNLFFRLSREQQSQAVATYERYRRVRSCVPQNAKVFDDLAEFAIQKYNITKLELLRANPVSRYEVLDTFNHFVRDWSNTTKESRALLFEPVLSRLVKLIPNSDSAVLLPGSGVGGLAHQVASLGYQVDAIEFSPTMHLGAEFATQKAQNYTVYPFLLEFSHLKRAEDQFEITDLVFDVSTAKFHFADFLKFDLGYRYNAVVTLFFIDTAENPIDYIDRISTLMAPGGIWINYGPLKWGTAPRVEFSIDEIYNLIKAKGWEIIDTFEGSNRYSGSSRSLWEAQYRIVGWTARRVSTQESTV